MRLAVVILATLLSLTAIAEVVSKDDAQLSKPRNVPTKSEPQTTRAISPPVPFTPQPYVPPKYKNGAGETGVKWDTGTSSSMGVKQEFDTDSAGKCGEGQDLWGAAKRVMSGGVIPPRKGYNLNATGWPRVIAAEGKTHCEFGANKKSMCTSATAAALCQHFSDLAGGKLVDLTSKQIAFLNGPAVRAAINGNTFSLAKLIQSLGGKSVYSGQNGGVKAVLNQAQTGDLLRFDRNNGTGHSTIFKEVKNGSEFCYWSSNTLTTGVGVQCEYIGVISQVVVSRFPSALEDFSARLDEAQRSFLGFTPGQANILGPQSVSWAGTLECEPN